MQGDQLLQLVGKVHAVFRHALREGILRQIVRVGQMVHARHHHRSPGLAVRHHAAHRGAADVHAVVAALAADEPRAAGFTLEALVLQGDLERRIHGLGARVHEEHMVEPGGRDLRHLVGEVEGLRVAHVEGRREVHLFQRLGHGLADFLAAMAGIDAPQAGDAVQDLAAIGRPVMHAPGVRKNAGLGLEVAVGAEGHPVRFELLAGQGAGAKSVGRAVMRAPGGIDRR